MESFFWLCGNHRCKEVGHLSCMCAASSCAAPVDKVMFRFCGRQGIISSSWLNISLWEGFKTSPDGVMVIFMMSTSLSVGSCQIKIAISFNADNNCKKVIFLQINCSEKEYYSIRSITLLIRVMMMRRETETNTWMDLLSILWEHWTELMLDKPVLHQGFRECWQLWECKAFFYLVTVRKLPLLNYFNNDVSIHTFVVRVWQLSRIQFPGVCLDRKGDKSPWEQTCSLWLHKSQMYCSLLTSGQKYS